jgi:hypothetical protein
MKIASGNSSDEIEGIPEIFITIDQLDKYFIKPVIPLITDYTGVRKVATHKSGLIASIFSSSWSAIIQN